MIVLCTDGVHDNLDPEFMGVPPEECQLSESKWSSGIRVRDLKRGNRENSGEVV